MTDFSEGEGEEFRVLEGEIRVLIDGERGGGGGGDEKDGFAGSGSSGDCNEAEED